MHQYYGDIIDKLGPPKWYDVHGFPRYCDFHPKTNSNIYANLVVLAKVGCQGCDEKFDCAFSWSMMYFVDRIDDWRNQDLWKEIDQMGETVRVIDWIKVAKLILVDNHGPFYGDPPNHPDDPGGSTMTSETTRIIECWIKENHDWVRHPEFEIHYDNN